MDLSSSLKQFIEQLVIFFSCRVMCNCASCGSRKQTLSEWEKHTGCRAKRWKHSVKVKSTMLPLEKWLVEHIPLEGVLRSGKFMKGGKRRVPNGKGPNGKGGRCEGPNGIYTNIERCEERVKD
ncbi:hypothetical protein VIGAN_01243100 [Vigna angularis var. angularis]|uniref:Uncharacterized protein n=1 Tax=Vigna angularis var. angularis TaxID=157739 RepID=A0A0S3R2F6_PHAAN|nr:hypothetical protein VIGAN_01243100 [Vigna angularis var. angularis]